MTPQESLREQARAAMAAAQADIEANGGVEDYGERPEWDLSREYRGHISEVKVNVEQGKTPRLTVVVNAEEPSEFSTSRAWLTFWLSEKALPYTMKELTPVLIKAGVTFDDLDLENQEKLEEQLVGQSVVFSLQAGRSVEYPEKRWLNPDRGQNLKPSGYFKKNITAGADTGAPAKPAAPGQAPVIPQAQEEPFPEVTPEPEPEPAPVVQETAPLPPSAPPSTGVGTVPLPPALAGS